MKKSNNIECCIGICGLSRIGVSAVASAMIMSVAVAWQVKEALSPSSKTTNAHQDLSGPILQDSLSQEDANASIASLNEITPIGADIINRVQESYRDIVMSGDYSSSTLESAANDIIKSVSSQMQVPNISPKEIKTTKDVSVARVLQYRADMRDVLSPLISIQEPEYATFARYVETKDLQYLTLLENYARIYKDVASSTMRISIPSDALDAHVSVTQALFAFASVLDVMVYSANDPFASALALREYNSAESLMFKSFNDLAMYYRDKVGVATEQSI